MSASLVGSEMCIRDSLKADHPKPPRGRADAEVAPCDSPVYRVAMTSKELSEGGEAAFRLAQGHSAVLSSEDHAK
eukprot:13480723-Alexandrium_andersonii.AAC.1